MCRSKEHRGTSSSEEQWPHVTCDVYRWQSSMHHMEHYVRNLAAYLSSHQEFWFIQPYPTFWIWGLDIPERFWGDVGGCVMIADYSLFPHKSFTPLMCYSEHFIKTVAMVDSEATTYMKRNNLSNTRAKSFHSSVTWLCLTRSGKWLTAVACSFIKPETCKWSVLVLSAHASELSLIETVCPWVTVWNRLYFVGLWYYF
jgi:hypothetical protein